MRANIWSSRPVSSPTVSRCAASGGNTPALRSGTRDAFAALDALRHALQRARDRPVVQRGRRRSRWIAPAARCWPPASPWRARSARSRPSAAHRPAAESSAARRPTRCGPPRCACKCARRSQPPATAPTATHQYVCTMLLASSMICVGIGNLHARVGENGGEPRHHEIQQDEDRARPTAASSAG